MTIQAYLKTNYVAACVDQRRIADDVLMIQMLRSGCFDTELAKSWMRQYGLLQGLTNEQRNDVVDGFRGFAASHAIVAHLTDDMISAAYYDLFLALYKKLARGWTSAASKLLWCLYPYQIVIYDRFVHRTVVVLQKIDPIILDFPRVGATPKVELQRDVRRATEHYMNYQAIVQKLLSTHTLTLNELRERHNESYPYDVRIVDKILWLLGKPG